MRPPRARVAANRHLGAHDGPVDRGRVGRPLEAPGASATPWRDRRIWKVSGPNRVLPRLSRTRSGRGRGPPPRATNLTSAALRAWSEDDFIRAMRFGARPDGTRIGPAMPWASRGQMTDDELRALWRYIRSAPHDSVR